MIDIDDLSEEELIDLNHRIVARLRFLAEARAHVGMLEFRIGDRVSFSPAGRPPVVGIISKYNRKTVTVISEGGQRWNVSPGLLERAPGAGNEAQSDKVVSLKARRHRG